MDDNEAVQMCVIRLPDPTVALNEFVGGLNKYGREGWRYTESIPMQVGRTRMNLQVFMTMPKPKPKNQSPSFEYKVERLVYDTDVCTRTMRVHTVGGWRLVKAMSGGHNGRFLFGIYEREVEKPGGKKKGPITPEPPAIHTARPDPAAESTAAANVFGG